MNELLNDPIASFIRDVILEAGNLILNIQKDPLEIEYKKGLMDIVSNADILSNDLLTTRILQRFPHHGIVSEESTNRNIGHEYVWYIDPLDGTKNFITKTPLWGINIALAHKGIIKYAAIYLPATQELCFAKEGFGTFLNGIKLNCSSPNSWEGIYGIIPVKFSSKNSKFEKLINEKSNKTAWFNKIASPAVSAVWISDGRRDFYISIGKNPWDFAAPYLICKEAGCIVKNYNGNNWQIGNSGFIASSPKIAETLLNLVQNCYVTDDIEDENLTKNLLLN